jgi:hypothetical protein
MQPTAKTTFDLPPFIGDLIQINIEGVDCRYCEDLGAFWDYISKKDNTFAPEDMRPKELFGKPFSKDKDKKEAGWIFEVRGFTFHNEREKFVLDTFAENLARFGMPDFNKDKPDEPLPTDKGPVRNRVSHFVLLPENRITIDKTDEALPSEFLAQSRLDALIQEALSSSAQAAAGMGAGTDPGMGAAQPPMDDRGRNPYGAASTGREGWTPANGGGSVGVPGVIGPGGPGSRPGKDRGGRDTPPPGEANRGTTTAGTGVQKRTEFVILFIWREPTPSDALRSLQKDASTTAGAPAPGAPAPGGPGPGVGR